MPLKGRHANRRSLTKVPGSYFVGRSQGGQTCARRQDASGAIWQPDEINPRAVTRKHTARVTARHLRSHHA